MMKISKLEVNKPIFLISLTLNCLILGAGIVWIYSKGGIPYLIRTVSYLINADMVDTSNFYGPDKISQFETLPKTPGEVVFLGDSLTDFGEWQEFFRTVPIKNRGISGDSTSGILQRINQVVEVKPQKVFILIGVNDLNQGKPVSEVVKNYESILKTFKEKTPQTQVFVQSVLPMNDAKFANDGVNQKIIQLNTQLQELAQKFSYQYIDLYPAFLDSNNQLDLQYTTDGLHLNGAGYSNWQKNIEKYVIQ